MASDSNGNSGRINFPHEELEVLKLWEELEVFKTCQQLAEDRPAFTFYDGPPFATGLPHFGHILAGSIKDVVTRYAYQNGHAVDRRFGWDCHGLPVEFEIDKTHNINGRADVLKMGISKYNELCRGIVMRYSSEWERTVKRMGRWVDFDNDYKTMYPSFMESVWWVFKTIFDRGHVYRGFKVMPYSTKCSTPLSNFEANQNYKDVQDPAVFVSFPLIDEPDVAFVAWTTTPWTLPSNLALCVNADLKYVRVQEVKTGKIYIIMEARLSSLWKKAKEYKKIGEPFLGKTLEGMRYQPLFNYFAELKDQAFRIVCDGYVSAESGTGVVHSAPAFGEDDMRVCLANGIIIKGGMLPCPVDSDGCFTEAVADWAGVHVKEADKDIIKHLKVDGRIVLISSVTHSYPFCWRSETPLIYKAVASWFIRVEDVREKLVANNEATRWVPSFVSEKRFKNWLLDARDWSISRNRFWGTPIPLWVSDDGEEIVCVGSIKELMELSGRQNITDIHRDFIDDITIPSRQGKGVLRRVDEVFDCWFESGSMPYAQKHYPFENKDKFESSFPADFIAEGIDQTRGWFYTLMVLSTVLFDRPPFKNLIVNGLVLAGDGKKMSKRLKNYPPVDEIVEKYGADALRLYLINSPVVRAETLKFKEEGVRDVIKDVFLPWTNALSFFKINTDRLLTEDGIKFTYDPAVVAVRDNVMDRWILSFTHSLLDFIHTEMESYRLYTVVPRLLLYIDNLTNWYVRANRARARAKFGVDDGLACLRCLFEVLWILTRAMSPFTPFLTENIYQQLKPFIVGSPDPSVSKHDSVHYLMMPKPNLSYIDSVVEQNVTYMQAVIVNGRLIRERNTLPLRTPLREIIVLHNDPVVLESIRSLEDYIKIELNVRHVELSSDFGKYGLAYKGLMDLRIMGRRLGKDLNRVNAAVKALSQEELAAFRTTGSIEVEGYGLKGDEIAVSLAFADGDAGGKHAEICSSTGLIIIMDTVLTQDLKDEGTARELVNRTQKLRKEGGLIQTEPIAVSTQVLTDSDDVGLGRVLSTKAEYIGSLIGNPLVSVDTMAGMIDQLVIMEEFQIGDARFKISVARRNV